MQSLYLSTLWLQPLYSYLMSFSLYIATKIQLPDSFPLSLTTMFLQFSNHIFICCDMIFKVNPSYSTHFIIPLCRLYSHCLISLSITTATREPGVSAHSAGIWYMVFELNLLIYTFYNSFIHIYYMLLCILFRNPLLPHKDYSCIHSTIC